VAFEAHIAGTAQLAQQCIDAIPAQVAAPLQVVHQHLPVVGSRQQVREQAAGRPGQARVLHRCLVDDDEAVSACRAADRLGHAPSAQLMVRATSTAG